MRVGEGSPQMSINGYMHVKVNTLRKTQENIGTAGAEGPTVVEVVHQAEHPGPGALQPPQGAHVAVVLIRKVGGDGAEDHGVCGVKESIAPSAANDKQSDYLTATFRGYRRRLRDIQLPFHILNILNNKKMGRAGHAPPKAGSKTEAKHTEERANTAWRKIACRQRLARADNPKIQIT